MGATDVIASVKAELGKPNSLQPNKGAGIDFSLFLAVLGKICWELYIDGLVVSSDGNLLDALGASIKAALSNRGIPRIHVVAGASSDEQTEANTSDDEFLLSDTSAVLL
ncbi:uncharacterized protein LOC129287400 isoform X1 [Prosopis cineraria]|uniref:uncharacterized protein LOC129287400 isoform X1 n=1 Tax=Prosopis cineraria TaxID=364024 RepID=UPI00240F097D|nr:uncharacterized protein LOC129287400 isoform X1 [Prosopis cineraria]XP_054779515.1 uncharacterized protein LOC129287400 isoform X1 [Prosopis cineraria]